jgi:transglutaminase-like putative cysteine protease
MTPRIHKLAWGNRGVRQTVRAMWAFILGYDPERSTAAAIGIIRRQAEAILRGAGVQFAPNALQAGALYGWVQAHLAYVGDHVLIEELRTPASLILAIEDQGDAMGDCDDNVILLAALLAAIGIRTRIVTVSTHADAVFDHTFLVVETTEGAIVADPILKDEHGRPRPFGDHVPPELITNYEEALLPPSLEALGLNPLEGSVAA